MIDFRRLEHVFLCLLVVMALLVGAARLIVHLSRPEVQLTLAAGAAADHHEAPEIGKAEGAGLKGSVMAALTPFPISRFGMLPYHVGVGWNRIVNGTSAVQFDETGTEAVRENSTDVTGITPDGRVDINRATVEELQTLPGIGPALAARILELREYRGGFVYPEELLDVSGIGPARYERLKDLIVIGPWEP